MNVRCWCAPLEPVPLGKTLGQTAGNNGGGGGGGGGQLHAGLLLDAHFATGLVDRGPTPGSEGVGAWTALWGERSETRRFKVREKRNSYIELIFCAACRSPLLLPCSCFTPRSDVALRVRGPHADLRFIFRP
eukprot:497969-Pleurochrysis_carterae.AAC.1